MYPKPGPPDRSVWVDSITPTFRWEPPSKNVTYDIIIYEALYISFWDPFRRPGKVVYYRQGLKEAIHKIEEPLKPNTEYLWSVRVREGEKVSEWSTYDYLFPLPLLFAEKIEKSLFLFTTPDK